MPASEICEQPAPTDVVIASASDLAVSAPELAEKITELGLAQKLAELDFAGKPADPKSVNPVNTNTKSAAEQSTNEIITNETSTKLDSALDSASDITPFISVNSNIAESASTAQATDARVQSRWRPSTRRLIILACIVLGVRIFIGEASVVPTASMEGTILVGDHLFMDKLLYGPEIPLVGWRLPMIKHIHRGDIIVFRYPKDPSETFLKRVAAMGGDRVEIRDSVLYVNSQPVQEPYAVHLAALHNSLESWGPVVVPEGRLFVMGDNRDNSSDSRDWGFVPLDNVIGSPMFVYWSYDAPTSRWLDENFGHKMTFYASIAENFFSHTRWSRTGTLL